MYAMLTVALLCAADVSSSPVVSPEIVQTAVRLRDAALKDDTAYRYLEDLTTEVGPRLAGTRQEARARQWTIRALKKLGFPQKSIRLEPFKMETWVRGAERVAITAPFPQPLIATALGRSASTGPRGLRGTVVVFPTIDELQRAPKAVLRGKIAYVGHAMNKTQDGSSYGYFGQARFRGPSIAAKKGAKAIMIRSIGTHSHRLPHTGVTGWAKDQSPIPAVAVSAPDADQIERIAARGERISVSMTVTPRILGMTESANVVVDLPGSDLAEQIVIVGGHLDSWDLGTGAVDDGAGVALTAAAVHLIRKMGLRSRRTIRLVHWGAEEVGLYGAKAYVKRHRDELDKHVLGSESDFGAERIYRIDSDLSERATAVVDQMLQVLAPIGVARGARGSAFTGTSGPDLSPLHVSGLPKFRLSQDGRDYFDLHHTPDDTFDKVDPAALAQNVATYAVFLWFAANADVDFRDSQATGSVKLSQ
ncbi:MAG: M20/M25/M40 family metallo-hydrolase [Myxococcota bacterium]